MTQRWIIAICTAWSIAGTTATPTVAFPFNSQVPTVARKNEQYTYQLSSSTFENVGADVVYSISQQPAWLSIDSSNRTLLGTPGNGDVGSITFTISATDSTGAAHMPCTLVVASDPAPQLQGGFDQQLAAEVNLTNNSPATVTITPGTPFSFHFAQDSFIDVVQRKLYYYATSTDHTPLPAWLIFDAASLIFSGTAPQLSAFPQAFQVSLIASDYQGFTGASASFVIVIATQQLAIVPSVQIIHTDPGSNVNYSLAQSIYLNGQRVSPASFRSATARLPSWAAFDAKSLTISGSVPRDEKTELGNVTITDDQGNTAQATLRFSSGNDTLYIGTIGTVTAVMGQDLQYTVPDTVLDANDVSLTLLVPPNADWLRLDEKAHIVHGYVPLNATPTVLHVTLQATASGVPSVESQAFDIDVVSANGSTTTPASSSSDGGITSASGSGSGLSPGEIAAIVICSIIGAAVVLALILMCCRHQRRNRSYVDDRTPSPSRRRLISAPTLIATHPDIITVTTQLHSDVEKAGEGDDEFADENKPPQIALEIPAPYVRSSKLLARSSALSQASSLGNAEDTIRRDGNIPELGQDSTVVIGQHDSFSVPTAIARAGSERAWQRRKKSKRKSKQSVGLGIDTGDVEGSNGGGHHKRRMRTKASSSGLSTKLERSSCASLSTQATSLLSTKPSDFPRPPTQSTFSGGSRSIPTLSYIDVGKRRSIRILRGSGSINDTRPMDVKRESFIRARASTDVTSPLFSHGSRQPIDVKSPGRGSSSDISSGILERWRSRRVAQRSTTSQMSLKSGSERDSRRLSQRVQSIFKPNFPRVVSGSEYSDDIAVDDDKDDEWEDVTPAVSRHQSANNLAAELAKPRHLRSWVLPGEASPTPPPTSRPTSSRKRASDARSRWRHQKDSSPFVQTVGGAQHSIDEEEAAVASPTIPKRSPKRGQSYDIDAMKRANDYHQHDESREQRPRLGDTKTSRPVSTEKVNRLSSLKAETGDTLGGSINELYDDDMQGTGIGPDKSLRGYDTFKSQMSGKAFL